MIFLKFLAYRDGYLLLLAQIYLLSIKAQEGRCTFAKHGCFYFHGQTIKPSKQQARILYTIRNVKIWERESLQTKGVHSYAVIDYARLVRLPVHTDTEIIKDNTKCNFYTNQNQTNHHWSVGTCNHIINVKTFRHTFQCFFIYLTFYEVFIKLS